MIFPRLRGSPATSIALLLPLALAVVAGAVRAETAEEAHATGSLAMRSRDYTAAAAAFEQAVALEPDNADYWFRLALARSRLSHWDDAIAAYERVIVLNPSQVMAHNNRANVYFRRGMYEEAAAAYQGALQADPDYIKALFHSGYVLRQLGRSAESERPFAHCVEVATEDPVDRRLQLDCLFYLGALRFRARDFEQAAMMMEQVVAGVPGNVEARYYLGMTYRRLGRLEEARQQLELHQQMLKQMRDSSPMERERGAES